LSERNEPPVLVERRGAVAVVTLNRPDKRNAINSALGAALARAIEDLDDDEDVSCIVITGAGDRAFCAGADMAERVAEMDVSAGGQPQPTIQREGNTSPGRIGDGIGAVGRARKPVIAAINGFAYGGGALLAVNTDIRLAAPNATIRFVGASYGLVVGGSQLPRIVGPAHAKELLFTARVVDADEAERIGLVNRVVRQGTVLEAAVEMGKQIAANSGQAVEWSKRVIDAATEVDQGRREEGEANRALRGSADHSSRFRDAAGRVTGSGTS
jgi:enoyl-CoA hydratase/carnithine racemase